MQIIAHRGAHQGKFEENTLTAFTRAVNMGFSMLELDARLTKDGHLVVHHDPEINHAGRRIKFREHLFENLVANGICTEGTMHFVRSQSIPSLKLVLDDFLPHIGINVELKEKGSGKILANLLKEVTGLKNLIVSSFEESELIVVKKEFPQMEMAWLTDNLQFPLHSVDRKKLNCFKRFGVEGIHFPCRKTTRELVDYLKYHHGFAVRVYLVNDRESMFNCLALGVDGVFTDKAEALSWMGLGQKSASQSVSV